MTTSSTPIVSEVLPPPSQRNTIFGWLSKNLFNGWGNSLLTIVSLVLIIIVLRPFVGWVFNSADWAVIPANWNLLMRGQYPAEEVWRLWLSLYLLAAVIGLSWGVWGRNVRGTTIVVFSIPLLLLLLPWLSTATRLNLLVMEAIAIACYAIGYARPPRIERIATIAAIALFPAVVLIVRGLGITDLMPVVSSNLWGGLLLSLLLSVVGIVFSFPLGVLLALGRQSKLPAIRLLCIIYIEFIRGVPLISLLFMSQVMLQIFLPAAMPPIDRVVRAMVAVTLFSAAYTAENVRGGLQSIPTGQYDAAHALGLNGFQTMTRIILPQAIVAVIPVLVGQFISLFKDTSLVALVGLFDLLGIARVILANPNWLGRQQEVYLVVGVIYWIFSYAMSYTSRQLEVSLGSARRS